ncbi:MAG: hypothetical protein JHD16_00840 [Solirubrobacteraceae bacterium]|nr:hypothetical protein [Solirubrobacteraceae bacterium]
MFDWFDEFSVVWDFRHERERNEAAAPKLASETRALVDRATRDLGLQDTLPPARRRYDHVLILGGLARGCLARPLHAAGLIASGDVKTGDVTAIGAFRPVNERERPILDEFRLATAETEFDVMEAGMRRAFALDRYPHVDSGGEWSDGSRWQANEYTLDGGTRVRVAAAPSPEPGRRANTGDTYEWLAAVKRAFTPGQSILIVTTFHYRLYQLADAIRILGLPHHLDVDAVGITPGIVDPRLAWEPTPAALLQEARSSVGALKQLYLAVATS